MDPVGEIEQAFVAHWSLLGQWPGARLVDEGGVLRFETQIPKIPYNGVIRTAIEHDPGEAISDVVEAYRRKGSEFFWVVHPSSTPADLADLLQAEGLDLAERSIGMSLELDAWTPPTPETGDPVEYAEVLDDEGLRAYSDIAVGYWEVDDEYRELVETMNRYWSGARLPGRRWVAFLEGEPIAKAYVSFSGPPGVAAIYGMSVRPEARGRGVASRLTQILLEVAKADGRERVVLHSSEMAVGVYRRAGFVDRCELQFFATAPIWSGKH